MSYIEADYDHMRDVLHERSIQQGLCIWSGEPTKVVHPPRGPVMHRHALIQVDEERLSKATTGVGA